jgi:hypothetical protein
MRSARRGGGRRRPGFGAGRASRRDAGVAVSWKALASVLVAAGLVMFGAAAAYAQGTLNVNPDSDLVNGSLVSVTGSGLAASSRGYLVECNMAPHEPVVALGSPFDGTLPVGCSAPSLKDVASVSSSGTLTNSFKVVLGRKLGPPCGQNHSVPACPRSDSAGNKAGRDSQDFPCPPTAAQQVAGVTCDLLFIDAALAKVSAEVSFSASGPGTGSTTTTVKSTATTTPKVTPTTGPVSTVPQRTGSTSPGTGTVAGSNSTLTNSAVTPTTVKPVTAPSTQLAFTGAGRSLRLLMFAGISLAAAGVLLWFVMARREPSGQRTRS